MNTSPFSNPRSLVPGLLSLVLSASALAQTNTFPSSGNVGIGTTSPSTTLEVRKDHASDPVMRISNGQTTRSPVILEFRGDYNGTGDLYRMGRMVAKADGGNWVDSRLTLQSIDDGGGFVDTLTVKNGGVGIGTMSLGSYKLAVEGSIRARNVVIDNATWPDYVFKPGYRLASLGEIEAHIQAHGTLPGVPSEAEVAKEGVNLGDMQARLLAKIEELTLHQIAQAKRLDDQAARIVALEQENQQLRSR